MVSRPIEVINYSTFPLDKAIDLIKSLTLVSDVRNRLNLAAVHGHLTVVWLHNADRGDHFDFANIPNLRLAG